MNAYARVAGLIVYWGLGIVQWSAELDGLKAVLHWPTFVCGFISVLTAWMPIVGSAAGIWGAHVAWGWGWPASLALFLGIPLLFLILVGALVSVGAMMLTRGVRA